MFSRPLIKMINDYSILLGSGNNGRPVLLVQTVVPYIFSATALTLTVVSATLHGHLLQQDYCCDEVVPVFLKLTLQNNVFTFIFQSLE